MQFKNGGEKIAPLSHTVVTSVATLTSRSSPVYPGDMNVTKSSNYDERISSVSSASANLHTSMETGNTTERSLLLSESWSSAADKDKELRKPAFDETRVSVAEDSSGLRKSSIVQKEAAHPALDVTREEEPAREPRMLGHVISSKRAAEIFSPQTVLQPAVRRDLSVGESALQVQVEDDMQDKREDLQSEGTTWSVKRALGKKLLTVMEIWANFVFLFPLNVLYRSASLPGYGELSLGSENSLYLCFFHS